MKVLDSIVFSGTSSEFLHWARGMNPLGTLFMLNRGKSVMLGDHVVVKSKGHILVLRERRETPR